MGNSNNTRRHNGDWNFSKRKNNTWTARRQFGYKEDGKPNIKAFYGNTLTEVKNKAKDYEIAIHENTTEIAKQTFSEYFDAWMKLYKRGKVKPTTYDSIDFCLNSRIKPYKKLANAQMHQVTANLLQEYFNYLASTEKYSYATI